MAAISQHWFLWNKIFLFHYELKKKRQTLLIILIVKSLQIELHSTNLLLWPPICQNKRAIIPKCNNSSAETNFTGRSSAEIRTLRQSLVYPRPMRPNLGARLVSEKLKDNLPRVFNIDFTVRNKESTGMYDLKTYDFSLFWTFICKLARLKWFWNEPLI